MKNELKKEKLHKLFSVLCELFPNGFTTKQVMEESKSNDTLSDALNGGPIGHITTTNGLGMLLMYRSRAKNDDYIVENSKDRINGYLFWKIRNREDKK